MKLEKKSNQIVLSVIHYFITLVHWPHISTGHSQFISYPVSWYQNDL